MSTTTRYVLFPILSLLLGSLVLAQAETSLPASGQPDPADERHEVMEGVGDAAKPVGGMLRGEAPFDHGVMVESLQTFLAASREFGDLVPAGSGGGESRAAPAIWEDPAGFEEVLAEWGAAIETAIAADPQSLDEARPLLGNVFNSCKNCHDGYRLEDD